MGVMTPYRAPRPPQSGSREGRANKIGQRAESHTLDALIGALAGSAAALVMSLVADRLYRGLRRPPQRRALLIASQIVWGAVLGWSSRASSRAPLLRDR